MIPTAVPEAAAVPGPATVPGMTGVPVAIPGTAPQPAVPGTVPTQAPGALPAARQSKVHLKFKATRNQIFKAFPAIANLADKSDGGKVIVNVEGMSSGGFDPSWLRNAVEEPLDEADIEKLTDEK